MSADMQTPPIFSESLITPIGISFDTPPVTSVPTMQIALVWPEKPWTANADNNMHYAVRAKNRAAWRDAFRDLSKACPRLAWCDLEVIHETATRRKVDYAACAPAAKAAMDGCRDFTDDKTGEHHARILLDDGPQFVASCKFWTPTYTGRDAMTLVLTGPLETD